MRKEGVNPFKSFFTSTVYIFSSFPRTCKYLPTEAPSGLSSLIYTPNSSVPVNLVDGMIFMSMSFSDSPSSKVIHVGATFT